MIIKLFSFYDLRSNIAMLVCKVYKMQKITVRNNIALTNLRKTEQKSVVVNNQFMQQKIQVLEGLITDLKSVTGSGNFFQVSASINSDNLISTLNKFAITGEIPGDFISHILKGKNETGGLNQKQLKVNLQDGVKHIMGILTKFKESFLTSNILSSQRSGESSKPSLFPWGLLDKFLDSLDAVFEDLKKGKVKYNISDDGSVEIEVWIDPTISWGGDDRSIDPKYVIYDDSTGSYHIKALKLNNLPTAEDPPLHKDWKAMSSEERESYFKSKIQSDIDAAGDGGDIFAALFEGDNPDFTLSDGVPYWIEMHSEAIGKVIDPLSGVKMKLFTSMLTSVVKTMIFSAYETCTVEMREAAK